MGANLDAFLGHDERAVHQGKVADFATPVYPDRKGTTGITGDMIAEDDRARSFALKVPKDLCALAIEAFAENHVRRDWVGPPIALDAAFVVDVAHEG
jgi:hypothetical protein